jgi:hypothetical protein
MDEVNRWVFDDYATSVKPMRYIAANAELLKSIRRRGTHLLGRIQWFSTESEARSSLARQLTPQASTNED